MSNVLIVSPGPDVAGCGISLKRAFDAVGGEWRARHVRQWDNWLHYPADVEWPKGADRSEVEALYRWADVVHVMDWPLDLVPGHGKPIVVQHLGSRYRRDPVGVGALCRRMGALEVADLDLLLLNPQLGYLPIAVDLDAPWAKRPRSRRRRVRIAHAPTKRHLKSTDLIAAAVERVARRHPVTFDLIEQVPWAECLARKARADLFVDELELGYGMNALECWAMRSPVISGAFPALRRTIAERFGMLPFIQAEPATLEQTIEALVASADLRTQWATRGRAYAELFHSPAAVVALATGHYRHALAAAA